MIVATRVSDSLLIVMVFDGSAVLLPMSSLDMGSRTARADKPTGPTARRQEKKIFRVRCEERAKEPHF